MWQQGIGFSTNLSSSLWQQIGYPVESGQFKNCTLRKELPWQVMDALTPALIITTGNKQSIHRTAVQLGLVSDLLMWAEWPCRSWMLGWPKQEFCDNCWLSWRKGPNHNWLDYHCVSPIVLMLVTAFMRWATPYPPSFLLHCSLTLPS